jgi:hypothetical protein
MTSEGNSKKSKIKAPLSSTLSYRLDALSAQREEN